MKKIGIVGGVGWQSTVDYYAGICRRSEQRQRTAGLPGPASMPEMTIESLDLQKAISYLGRDDDEASWSQFDEYHRVALQRLEACGAEFAVIASNTPHHRLDTIVRGVSIPVVSMFTEVAKECARMEARNVLILGTAVTMRSQRFREQFAHYGIEAHGPHNETERSATIRLVEDLQAGRMDGSAGRLRSIAEDALEDFGPAPVVCLACTELLLAFEEREDSAGFEAGGIFYLNTTNVHIDAAFAFAAGGLTGRDSPFLAII